MRMMVICRAEIEGVICHKIITKKCAGIFCATKAAPVDPM
jgi:hypothetical protein